jgi:branched-chain amino acid transport system substrate-binding protein
MLRKLLVGVVVLTIGVLGSGAFGQEPIIKIGAIVPLSPPGAYVSGTEMRWGMEIAVEEVNAAGGVLGRPIELIVADSRGLPEEGTAAAKKLIVADKVVSIVGVYHSAVGIPVSKVAHEYGIPFIAVEPWADIITAVGYPEVFRICVATSLYLETLVSWVEAVGFKHVALMIENTDFGLSFLDTISKRFDELGIAYSYAIVDWAKLDFTPELLKFKFAEPRPDILFNIVTGAGSYRVTRQAFEIGFAPTPQTAIFTLFTSLYPEFWPEVGEAGKYVIVENTTLPEVAYTPVTRAFIKVFEEKHGRKPGPPTLAAYDSIWLLAKAIKAANTTEPEAVMDALRHIQWPGTRGLIYFPYGVHNPLPEGVPAWMWQQWPDAPVHIIQYTEVGQDPKEARIIWPPKWVFLVPPE